MTARSVRFRLSGAAAFACTSMVVVGLTCAVIGIRNIAADDWWLDDPIASGGLMLTLVGVMLALQLGRRSAAGPAVPAAVASGRYDLIPPRQPVSRRRALVLFGALAAAIVAFIVVMVLFMFEAVPFRWFIVVVLVPIAVSIVAAAIQPRRRDRLPVQVEFEPFPFVAGAKGTVRIRPLAPVEGFALSEASLRQVATVRTPAFPWQENQLVRRTEVASSTPADDRCQMTLSFDLPPDAPSPATAEPTHWVLVLAVEAGGRLLGLAIPALVTP